MITSKQIKSHFPAWWKLFYSQKTVANFKTTTNFVPWKICVMDQFGFTYKEVFRKWDFFVIWKYCIRIMPYKSRKEVKHLDQVGVNVVDMETYLFVSQTSNGHLKLSRST